MGYFNYYGLLSFIHLFCISFRAKKQKILFFEAEKKCRKENTADASLFEILVYEVDAFKKFPRSKR